MRGYLGGSAVKNPSAMQKTRAKDIRFNSWVGKISGEGIGYPLQVQSFFSTFLEFLETSFLQVIDKTILLTYDLVSELLLT